MDCFLICDFRMFSFFGGYDCNCRVSVGKYDVCAMEWNQGQGFQNQIASAANRAIVVLFSLYYFINFSYGMQKLV